MGCWALGPLAPASLEPVRAILATRSGMQRLGAKQILVSFDQLGALLFAVTSQGPCVEEIICKRCGVHASIDEDFCGGCGAFLEWEGERVEVPDGPAPISSPPPSDQTSAPRPPPPSGPVAVQPAPPIERPKPPPPRPQTQRAEPGDIFCGQCGQPNNPGRRFCRKCGSVLAEQVAVARLPWWKRIFHRHPSDQKGAAKAGEPASGGPPTASAAQSPAKAGAGGAAAPRPPASPSGPKPPSPHYAAPRQVAPVRMPAPPSARTHRLRGKLVLAVLLVVVVFAVVPSLRHQVSKGYTKVEGVFVPTYSKVPLAAAKVANAGDCGPAQLQGNDTVYWYTRAGGGGSELLTMTIASSFTGTISKIAFTPLQPATHAAQAGQASPYPQQVVLSSTPAGAATVINLNNPPAFQHENIQIVGPKAVNLRLVTTDPGAAAGTCAEMAVVLYEKTN